MRSRDLAQSEILRGHFRVNGARKRVRGGMIGWDFGLQELNWVDGDLIEPKMA